MSHELETIKSIQAGQHLWKEKVERRNNTVMSLINIFHTHV